MEHPVEGAAFPFRALAALLFLLGGSFFSGCFLLCSGVVSGAHYCGGNAGGSQQADAHYEYILLHVKGLFL